MIKKSTFNYSIIQKKFGEWCLLYTVEPVAPCLLDNIGDMNFPSEYSVTGDSEVHIQTCTMATYSRSGDLIFG